VSGEGPEHPGRPRSSPVGPSFATRVSFRDATSLDITQVKASLASLATRSGRLGPKRGTNNSAGIDPVLSSGLGWEHVIASRQCGPR